MKTRTTTIEKLRERDFVKETLPLQVVDKDRGKYPLPPQFLVTGLDKLYDDRYYLNYYCPKSKKKNGVYVPKNLELEVLLGTEGDELLKEWQVEKVGILGQRLGCTVGTDPEVFVVDKKGEVIPAWEYLPSKKKPVHFSLENGGYSEGDAYWDGFQAEFTADNDNRTCLSWLVDNVHIGLKTIHQAAQKVGGRLTIQNVVPVDPEVLETAKEEHVQFGCAPSYNVYGLAGNTEDGRRTPYRFAGGHLHFGIAINRTKAHIEKYVRALDMVLGVASVSLFGELDSPIRRRYYGLPGEYRTPNHGFEYRTLSNAWMCHPLAMNIVFDLARAICGLAKDDLLGVWESNEEETLGIIIENDIDRARRVLKRNHEVFKQICKVTGRYSTKEDLNVIYKIWSSGIDSAVQDPKDLVTNWNLTGGWKTHGDGPGKNWYYAYDTLMAGKKV